MYFNLFLIFMFSGKYLSCRLKFFSIVTH